jgi:hypothetical protein
LTNSLSSLSVFLHFYDLAQLEHPLDSMTSRIHHHPLSTTIWLIQRSLSLLFILLTMQRTIFWPIEQLKYIRSNISKSHFNMGSR